MSARRPRPYAAPRLYKALSVPAALAVVIGAGVAIAATPRASAEHVREFGPAAGASRQAIEEAVPVSCGNGERSCAAEIYTVPERHRLELRRVACSVKVRTPGRVEDGAVLFSGAAKGRFGPIVPVRLGMSDGRLEYRFDTTAQVTGAAGARLVVGVNADNDVSGMTCTFAGDLIAVQ